MNIFVNGKEKEVADDLTLDQLILQLALPIEGLVAVLNDDVIPIGRWKTCLLFSGVKVELLNFVSGG